MNDAPAPTTQCRCEDLLVALSVAASVSLQTTFWLASRHRSPA